MPEAVIIDAVRTPLGKRNGALADWQPADLAAETLKALADRTGIDPVLVDDVIMGCVSQVGEQTLSLIHISEPTRRTIPSRMPSSA